MDAHRTGPSAAAAPAATSVIVTGASSGFGAAIVRRMAAAGRPVVAVARRKDRLDSLVEELGTDKVHSLPLDIRDSDAVTDAFSALPADFADVGALINNAGLSKGFGPVQDAELDHWREMVDTNVMGLLHCVRAVLPSFLAAKRGDIVNIGSIAAVYPYMGGNVYGGTKAFAHQLSLNLRTDLEASGIRVSCIAPGMARTEFALVRFDGDQERADALYADNDPLTPEDIAETVDWCLSRPRRVNINLLEVMPTSQPFGLGFRSPTPTANKE
ncbi:SDR family NAD(P)-dependent oxidoreductase [Streptomyces sp. B-S-A8]|uniref:SDR family NAD(P)-dependent oxidoreductase n=1 Tax=Streptomyces solicavernae TaxID=3043614 RepID=A0ABT6RYF1_9ACTN|nr:SDR family NAD(P)-dependent oxidoreductase [Streptomyces sp. B-S-A8]MDI3389355.1 SDR family NAD(P)-dependent oxidoreductase [Streptomyces sp. B-S-A8]